MGKLPMYISKLAVLNPCQRVGPGPVRKYSSLILRKSRMVVDSRSRTWHESGEIWDSHAHDQVLVLVLRMVA